MAARFEGEEEEEKSNGVVVVVVGEEGRCSSESRKLP